jgi:hypothetical protein
MAPGFTYESAVIGRPEAYFNPAAFLLQPAGTLGTMGRGALIGPNLRTFDLSMTKEVRAAIINEDARIQIRVEAFNLFNRVNFGNPALLAFAGLADNERPFGSLGAIRSTVTSSRQIQLGLRLAF